MTRRTRAAAFAAALTMAAAPAAHAHPELGLIAQATPTPAPPPFATGAPFREPPVVRSRNGRLRHTLVARNGTIEVGGLAITQTQTYGIGTRPRGLLGPTLHVQPGDLIDLVLDNQLVQPPTIPPPATPDPAAPHAGECEHDTVIPAGHPQPTNLHFHGLHVTPRNHRADGVTYYGDNVFACLRAGRSHIRFRIPANHDQGTFWYHAHLHGLTDDQVFRGLAGMLLVGDSRTELPKRLRRVRTRLISIKDVQAVQSAGAWAIPSDHFWGNATTPTVNGIVQPKLTIRPGETQLWRLGNTSSGVWYDLGLQDAAGASRRFTIVARDGNRLVAPQRVLHALLPPGQRLDVLVTAPRAGSFTLQTLPFAQGATTFPAGTLATIDVAGATARDVAGPRRAGKLPPFPSRRGPARTWRFSIAFPRFEINGKTFMPGRVDAAPRLGTTERWTLINDSSEWHPIHIHQDDYRVVSVNGERVDVRSDQDVIALPPERNGAAGRVVLDMPFQDFSGDFVMHCHILDHEDGGMMARIEVSR